MMKESRILVFAAGLGLAGMLGSSAPAQAPPAKRPATVENPRTATQSFKRALLNPVALNARAPEAFDVKFTTTKGDFVVRVTRAWAPLGADRFFNLARNGFYDEAHLFRVVPGFVVQFGLSAHPQVSAAWQNANLKDDPVKQSNKRGFVSYAMAGPNTRTTQVFINLGNNARLDGMGFAPFGEVVEGMDVVESLYSGYAEAPTGRQGEIAQGGKVYLERTFPKLDKILKALVAVSEEPATPPKKSTP